MYASLFLVKNQYVSFSYGYLQYLMIIYNHYLYCVIYVKFIANSQNLVVTGIFSSEKFQHLSYNIF